MESVATRYFKVRSSDVVSEIIDGEAVIMDLRTGHYFSARQASAQVWSDIAAGKSDVSILETLRENFDADADYLKTQLHDFIDTLMRHALIVLDVLDQVPAQPGEVRQQRGSRPFTPLLLEVFQDMEELLLLDPIHEVQEEFGWPVRKPDGRQ